MRSKLFRPLSIVMYHYVRAVKRSRYPGIKGLELELFVEQLDYLQRHYVLVRPEEVIAAAKGEGDPLPRNGALLTFDDGYIDHFTNVFPILFERGLSAMFFPVVTTVRDHRVLDINKIHFVLASVDRPDRLVETVFGYLDEFREEFDLKSNDDYFAEYAKPSRWDPAEISFVKSMLQHVLPEEVRRAVSQQLFERFVSADEQAFACELYMSEQQLRAMIGSGMYVGSHSMTHPWLNILDAEQQAREIDGSLAFMKTIGAPTEDWVMCYPFGAFDDTLLDHLRRRRCAVGLTTDAKVADFSADDPLLLPRLDTNHLPNSASAEPNEWTRAITS